MSQPYSRLLFASLLLCLCLPAFASEPVLSTAAERSNFTQTGRYDEVPALCRAFAGRHPESVRCIEFGTTPEGRPMKALVASTSGTLMSKEALERKLPVVLIQGGIHAGEIDGQDAGFLALRETLEGTLAPDTLDRLVWVFVPVFNVDGHERFGAWNRPNQRGPKEMGWRTTAQNHNLNRDYLKADSVEMQAMLRLVEEWDPLLYVDLHATNGAQFEHDISIQVEPLHAGDDGLRIAGRELRDGVINDLAAQGSLPLPFYPSFVIHDDPASGFIDDVPPPRFSHGYFLLRNRLAMLVETHSWKEYPTRVRITRNTISSVLEQVAEHGPRWLQQARAADAASLAGTSIPLTWKAGDTARDIDFRGYAYTRTPSEVSGALMTRYDETTPQIWTIPLRDDLQPDILVDAPLAGYIVPIAHASRVGERLSRHGVTFRETGALANATVQTFRADKTSFGNRPVEGHQRLTVEGEWKPEARDIPAGSLFVPIHQPRARLVMAMLEPLAPDSLLAWGEFNPAFEKKEYMEAYVAEAVARDMLANDPELAREFERRLRDDPEFAASPEARLEFFHRRHSSWDERLNLYPVMRTDTAPH